MDVVGYEILTNFPDKFNSEFYFNNITAHQAIVIFLDQLKKVKYDHASLMPLYFNLPVRSFIVKDLFTYLDFSTSNKICIEVQDIDKLYHLTGDELNKFKNNISSLRGKGFLIWLDDMKKIYLDMHVLKEICVDGIKIDKSELKKQTRELSSLVNACKKITNSIIVEGIETIDDLAKAAICGSDMGQGYLWKNEFIFSRSEEKSNEELKISVLS